jgi:hypothetical protein
MHSLSSSSNQLFQSIKVWLDKSFLQTTKGGGEILTSLENANIASIIEKLPVENSIFWTRAATTVAASISKKQNETCNEMQHDHILVKVELDKFVEFVNDFSSLTNSSCDKSNSNLINFVKNVKKNAQVTQITFLVPGFKQYFK